MTGTSLPPVKRVSTDELYACRSCANGAFDAAPLLNSIINDATPDEMAQALDEAHTLLVEAIIMDAGLHGLHYVSLLYSLRVLRDALLKGAGGSRFDRG